MHFVSILDSKMNLIQDEATKSALQKLQKTDPASLNPFFYKPEWKLRTCMAGKDAFNIGLRLHQANEFNYFFMF